MTDSEHRLNLTDPTKGYTHFVLYSEPEMGVACAALNAEVSIERDSPYVGEWRERLQKCQPTALHTALVDSRSIPTLPPVRRPGQEQPLRSGCTCYQTFFDPVSTLPVLARHHRAARGSRDRWTYQSYAPLDLRPDDTIERLILDRSTDVFWARTADGTLSFLPEKQAGGYNIGYSGGGPTELARYLTQLLASNGKMTAAGATPSTERPDPKILEWATTPSDRAEVWSLRDLRNIQQA